MPPSPVVMTLRGWNEKQAIVTVGPADPLPLPATRISLPAAQAASSIRARPWRSAIGNERGEVAGHSHLVDGEDRAGARRDAPRPREPDRCCRCPDRCRRRPAWRRNIGCSSRSR